MHSSVDKRPIVLRAQGVAFALLVQGLFLWALLFATIRHPERAIEHETILIFHPAQPVQPRTIDARGASGARSAPGRAIPVPVPFSPLPQSVPQLVPQGDLRAFGQALRNCAPENYANLPPDERQHCPKPGEGLAANPPPDLLNGDRSHVKDNARWANALAHKQSPVLLPGGLNFPIALLESIMDGSIADSTSAIRDPQKWGTYKEPARPVTGDEHNHDAWGNDPSQAIHQAPGRH